MKNTRRITQIAMILFYGITKNYSVMFSWLVVLIITELWVNN